MRCKAAPWSAMPAAPVSGAGAAFLAPVDRSPSRSLKPPDSIRFSLIIGGARPLFLGRQHSIKPSPGPALIAGRELAH